uniref:Uncharacterized protein n=1 Tax=Aplanochytrium stocchinoi TaxID=215587 RepID=A0A7S3PLB0_9STRA|mmetsp:Transcript_27622/g.33777  ORF Transcript_27622/g.33777 Transcript_27622/m.33777 type:complete len:534 (+) Transcript_27622:89-1690(+)
MLTRKEQLLQWREERERKNTVNVNVNSMNTKPKSYGNVSTNLRPRDHQKETFSYKQMKSPWVAHRNTNENQTTVTMNDENAPLNFFDNGPKKVYAKTPAATRILRATPTKPAVGLDNLTPTRLVFNSNRKQAQEKGQLSCKAIRERLLARSERKENRLRDMKKAKNIKAEMDQTIMEKFATVSNLSDDLVQFNNLKRTVKTQVEATNEFIKNGSYEQARNDLKILVEEIPMSVECGEFWTTLATIEEKVRGDKGVATVLALAFDNVKKPEELEIVQDACRNFLWKRMKLHKIDSVGDILEKPERKISSFRPSRVDESMIFKEDEGLGEYFSQEVKVSPDTEEDFFNNSPQDNDENDMIAEMSSPVPAIVNEGDESSVTKLSAQKFKTSFLKVKPARIAAASPFPSSDFLTEKEVKVKKEEAAKLGSMVVLSAINAKPKLAAELGTNKVMTPVRRAVRHREKVKSEGADEVLSSTGYAYTPNKALDMDTLLFGGGDDDMDTPRPMKLLARSRGRIKTEATPENIRKELESLLIS